MQSINTRICILGGGPAGTTASLFLSRYGIRHVLVDKASFPRDKVCGESFDGRVYRLLEELLPGSVAELQAYQQLLPTRNYRFGSRKIDLSVAFPSTDLPRLSIQRRDLDHYLWQQAASSSVATLWSGQQLRIVEQSSDGIVLQGTGMEIRAELVINATGAQAVPFDDPALFVFSRQYYEGVQTNGPKGLEVRYFYDPLPVCLFLCPLAGGRYNVELAMSREEYKRSGLRMEDILQSLLETDRDLKGRFAVAKRIGRPKGTSLPLQTLRRWFAPGMIYAGSSAFTTNPITGLGVGNAMSMGKLAAELIRQYHNQPDFVERLGRAYGTAARRKYRNILLMNKTVNLVQRHFRFLEPTMARVLRLPLVQNKLLKKDLTKGIGSGYALRKTVSTESK